MKRKTKMVWAVRMVVSAFLLLNTVGALGQPGPTAHGDTMQSGEVLKPNQQINSANGRYSFAYQSDSNLVLYKNNPGRPGTPLWSSVTTGKSAGVLVMEGDGNLVIYDAGRQRVWSSNTANNPGSRLVVQNDGNVVRYRPDRTPIWSTNAANTHGDTIGPGVVLKPSPRAGQPASNTRSVRTCSAMPSASTWPTPIRTPARFSSISGKRIATHIRIQAHAGELLS